MINQLVGTIMQLVLFTTIPFIVYLVQKKTARGFWEYIGLKKSTTKANLLAFLVTLLIVTPILLFAFLLPDFREVLTDPKSVTGSLRQMDGGMVVITAILLIAVFKTALAEEIFFRGFIAKRLIALTNFKVGNTLQALLFGAIHGLLFLGITSDPFFLTVIFLVPTLGAWAKGYLNEKVAAGSIIPGWIAHASANLIAYTTVVFVL